jgi:formylglycine-generating enzyme required for sulfatase activity
MPMVEPPFETGAEKPSSQDRRYAWEPELVLIPAGSFSMGSDPERDRDAWDYEQPQHHLHLPAYHLARTPVTNTQYAAFVSASGRRAPHYWDAGQVPPGKETHPVVLVSWYEALAYTRWLAQVTGRPYRLPTEAEWEKGARGTDGRLYPWGDTWDRARCNNRERGPRNTTPVGQYPAGASPYGLLDMAGNVGEWTASVWGISWEPGWRPQGIYYGYPYEPGDGRENLRASRRLLRVVRGGSFDSLYAQNRCADRRRMLPESRFRFLGFRVAARVFELDGERTFRAFSCRH